MLYYGIKPESLGQLGALGRQVCQCQEEVVELKVKFLRPYGVAYLDQMMLYEKGTRTRRYLVSTYPNVNQYLKQIGFKHLHPKAEGQKPFPQEDIIKVKRFGGTAIEVEMAVVNWLMKKVIPCLPSLSPEVHKKIVENLWEIVHNGLYHGNGKHGVTGAGQFYPAMGYFEVAFYDRGYGIPARVRDFGAIKSDKPDSECINWAIQKGNSTEPISETSGLGLHVLREFLMMNGGLLQIVSGNGYFHQSGGDPETFRTETMRNSIDGTLVNIRVIYDDRLYMMAGEDL
ncbi:MAG: hypothetical protein JRN15_19890 [Nitrososphaerota archaeon]|nr:hypothetical protein [Nitrososphaerota archaeon]